MPRTARNVLVLHAYGVKEALTRDEPTFPDITDDQLDAAASTYADADPQAVVEALLAEAAERMAHVAEDAGFNRRTRHHRWRNTQRGTSPARARTARFRAPSRRRRARPGQAAGRLKRAIPATPFGLHLPRRRIAALPSRRHEQIGGRCSVPPAVQGRAEPPPRHRAPSVPIPPDWARSAATP